MGTRSLYSCGTTCLLVLVKQSIVLSNTGCETEDNILRDIYLSREMYPGVSLIRFTGDMKSYYYA